VDDEIAYTCHKMTACNRLIAIPLAIRLTA